MSPRLSLRRRSGSARQRLLLLGPVSRNEAGGGIRALPWPRTGGTRPLAAAEALPMPMYATDDVGVGVEHDLERQMLAGQGAAGDGVFPLSFLAMRG